MFAKAGFAAAIVLLLAGSPASASDLLHCPTADLTVSMTGSQQLRPGEAGSYRIVVENQGDAYAWYPKVRVSVDSALRVTNVPGDCELIDNKIKCKRKKLPDGQSWVIELPFRASLSAVPGRTTYTTAEVTSKTDEDDKSDNSAAISTLIRKPFADLEISAAGPTEFAPGRSYDLTFKITNRGPATASRARMTGAIDDQLIIERLSNSCRFEDSVSRLTCDLREIPAGTSRELSASVRLGARPVGGTPITNRLTVTGPSTDDPDRSDNDATVNGRIAPARLSLRTGVDEPSPRRGGSLTFTVAVENAAGAGTAADVVIADRLPASVDLIAAEPSQGEVETGDDGRLLWSVGDLPAGAAASLALRVRVRSDASAGTVLVNQAGVVRGPPATVTGPCPGTPQESCSTTDPLPAGAGPAEDPTSPESPGPDQNSPESTEPRPTPTETPGRPGPTPTPTPTITPTVTPTPEPTQRIGLVPYVPRSSTPGPGFGPLLVVSMLLTSVLVAARLFLFLRRR